MKIKFESNQDWLRYTLARIKLWPELVEKQIGSERAAINKALNHARDAGMPEKEIRGIVSEVAYAYMHLTDQQVIE